MSSNSAQRENKFVYILKEFTAQGITIQDHEIGIVIHEDITFWTVRFIRPDITANVESNNLEVFDPLEVGDAFPYKVCNVCHRLLPTDQFPYNQNGRNNRRVRRPSCYSCRRDIDGKKMSSAEKRRWEPSRPNLEFFKCPICGKNTVPGLTSKVVIDHDHDTGVGRAWICDSCNTGLGRYKDDVEILKQAIKYLEGHQKD